LGKGSNFEVMLPFSVPAAELESVETD